MNLGIAAAEGNVKSALATSGRLAAQTDPSILTYGGGGFFGMWRWWWAVDGACHDLFQPLTLMYRRRGPLVKL